MCQPVDNELTVKFLNEKLAEEVADKNSISCVLGIGLTCGCAGFCQASVLSQVKAKLAAYRKLVLDTSKKLRMDFASVASTARGRARKPGFLASRVMPVDGFKIRNSLFLSVRSFFSRTDGSRLQTL